MRTFLIILGVCCYLHLHGKGWKKVVLEFWETGGFNGYGYNILTEDKVGPMWDFKVLNFKFYTRGAICEIGLAGIFGGVAEVIPLSISLELSRNFLLTIGTSLFYIGAGREPLSFAVGMLPEESCVKLSLGKEFMYNFQMYKLCAIIHPEVIFITTSSTVIYYGAGVKLSIGRRLK